MRSSSVTRRYAKALSDLVDPATAESARTALERLSLAITETASLRHLLASPAFRADEKSSVLLALAQRLNTPDVLTRFLTHLAKRDRAMLLPDITEAFRALLDEAKGRSKIEVHSAKALSRDEESRIKERLQQILRREVEVAFETQPGLLSGLQIRIGSTVYDSSVRTRLTAMQTILTKE